MLRRIATNEKLWLPATVVFTSVFAASLALLYVIYGLGFEANLEALFTKLTPTLIGVCLLALFGTGLLVRQGSRDAVLVLSAIAIIVSGHLLYYRLIHSFFDFAIDDTFITFRYSRHLADGFGPTFNLHGQPVEGYTTFLWMLVMSIPHLLKFDALVFSKLVGIACGEITIVLAMLIAAQVIAIDRPAHRLLAAAVTCFFISAFYPMAIHSVSGMETILFTALLAGTVYLAVLSKNNTGAAILTPAAMLLLGLTRPEGNLLNGGILAVLLLTHTSAQRRTFLYSAALLYFVPGLVYFLWRLSYYRLLFPLPYYSKLGNNHRPEGIPDVTSFILIMAPFIMFWLLFTLRKAHRHQYVVALPIVLLLLFYVFPQHIMGVHSRFVFPVAPLIHALAGAGVISLLAEFEWRWGDWSMAMKSVFAFVGVALVALSPLTNFRATQSQVQGAVRAIEPYIYFGRLLQSFPAAVPLTLAIGDAGAIPYYSQWKTIDLVGLNDPVLLFETSVPDYLDYVFQQDPDLILLTFNDPVTPVRDVALTNQIYEAALARGMQKVGVLKVSGSYYLWICARPGTPLEEYLKKSLKGES